MVFYVEIVNGDGFVNFGGVFFFINQKVIFKVNFFNVEYIDNQICFKYIYYIIEVFEVNGQYVVVFKEIQYNFNVDIKVFKLGMMFVGWGGNNGFIVIVGIIVNCCGFFWQICCGEQKVNYYGFLIMGFIIKFGIDVKICKDVNIFFYDFFFMVYFNDIVIGGWDISKFNFVEVMDCVQVFEFGFKVLVVKEMVFMVFFFSIYYFDFIVVNQEKCVDNIFEGIKVFMVYVEKICQDIWYVVYF